MNVEDEGAAGALAPPTRAKHIGIRALKNKSVTVSFDEKDLRYRTTMYDTGELKVTMTTSEISREEDEPVRREKTQSTESDGSTAKASTSQPAPLRKSKPSKQNRRHKSSTKTMKKRDKKRTSKRDQEFTLVKRDLFCFPFSDKLSSITFVMSRD
ncbi:hypothetical protein HID58_080991 [Brassica napus]|uniref:Uncharacterized protein n=2 Tax=Brassica napus TaxID=3708 RepID=A0ABQ7Y6F4_BRANA|nr:hypothetical protein HID58_080991 [Brassica napus]